MKKLVHAFVLLAAALLANTPARAQEVLRLWDGKAPGSENVSVTEKVVPGRDSGVRISDVTDPTLTVYLPDPATANGTAVILAPGGGMRVLGVWDYETGPAKWFNDRGIAAFVLKYRLIPSNSEVMRLPLPEMTSFPKGNSNPYPTNVEYNAIMARAYADAHQAMRLVRSNAANWRIDPNKVGMLGYSAGGCVSLGAMLIGSEAERPNFVISAYGPPMIDIVADKNSTPVFLAVSQYHPNVARGLLAFYQEWTLAGAPGELHVYDHMGGSPFLDDTGQWLEAAYGWMIRRGFASQDRSAGSPR